MHVAERLHADFRSVPYDKLETCLVHQCLQCIWRCALLDMSPMIALCIIGNARCLDASPMYHIIIDVAEHSTYFSDNAGDQWFFELRLQLNGI